MDDGELREFAESQGFEVQGDEGFAVSQGFADVKVDDDDDDEDHDEFLPSQGFQMAKTMIDYDGEDQDEWFTPSENFDEMAKSEDITELIQLDHNYAGEVNYCHLPGSNTCI